MFPPPPIHWVFKNRDANPIPTSPLRLSSSRSKCLTALPEQAVVAHACHGHRYQPSPVPLSGTGYNISLALRPTALYQSYRVRGVTPRNATDRWIDPSSQSRPTQRTIFLSNRCSTNGLYYPSIWMVHTKIP